MKISSTNEVDENELLRQAVKNVKERVSDFENDVCQLKEDNVKLVETSQEKETENQALQETNMRLSMTWGEKDFQYVGMKEKAFACEQRLKDREQGQTGEFSQLFNAVTSLQGKTVLFQQERHEVTVLWQKQVENCALWNEVKRLCDKESHLTQELERSRTCGLELEDARDREAVVAEQKAAKLRTKVTALEEKLLSSARAMKKVSQKAALQVESLKDQLDAVTKQKEETVSQLATSQKQGKQYAQALADSKVVLAEWMGKADRLKGKLSSLKGLLNEAHGQASRRDEETRWGPAGSAGWRTKEPDKSARVVLTRPLKS